MFSINPNFAGDCGDRAASSLKKGWYAIYCSAPETFLDAITRFPWSPMHWAGGERLVANMLGVIWCVLDFDDPETTLAGVERSICDMQHVIGTTKSHQREKNGIVCDRFRVAIPFSAPPENYAQYNGTMRRLVRTMGADRTCSDGARFYWPCREIVATNLDPDAYTMDLVSPAELEREAAALAASCEQVDLAGRKPSLFCRNLHYFGAPVGKRNKLYFMGALELARKGFSFDEICAYIYRKQPTAPDFSDDEKRTIVRSALTKASEIPQSGKVYG